MTLSTLIDFALHLNLHIADLFQHYHTGAYLILMLIIFSETGFLIFPFLPGDSLLFAIGVILGARHEPIFLLIFLLVLAAFLGDNLNYCVGRTCGRRLFARFPTLLKQSYLHKTEAFYRKYGNKTIVLSRFLPILRSFAPCCAGLSKMPYGLYASLSFFSALFWVSLLTLAGYYFGGLPFIKNHFSLVILLIILISILPVLIEYIKNRLSL